MLNRVDTGGGDVSLYEGRSEEMPFVPDGSVDVVTAYSLIHHLFDLRPTLSEAFRCLRAGGILYTDQDPNRSFWSLMHEVKGRADLPPLVRREVQSVVQVVDEISRNTGLAAETVELAEFQKIRGGGIEPDAVYAMLRDVGFHDIEIRYEWFLGEGVLRRQQGEAVEATIAAYLRSMLPATRHLFKYVAIKAVK